MILIRGTGLLGTSIGLGLRAGGHTVLLSDPSSTAQSIAQDIGAGQIWDEQIGDALTYAFGLQLSGHRRMTCAAVGDGEDSHAGELTTEPLHERDLFDVLARLLL